LPFRRIFTPFTLLKNKFRKTTEAPEEEETTVTVIPLPISDEDRSPGDVGRLEDPQNAISLPSASDMYVRRSDTVKQSTIPTYTPLKITSDLIMKQKHELEAKLAALKDSIASLSKKVIPTKFAEQEEEETTETVGIEDVEPVEDAVEVTTVFIDNTTP